MFTKSYRNTLMFRWSVATAAAIALFWTGYYLVNGSVPVVSEIKFTETYSITLPFTMSRWWDILIGPIWSVAIIYLITTRQLSDDDIILFALLAGLFASLFVGLVVGFGAGLFAGLLAALDVGLVIGLSAGLFASLGAGLGVGLGAGFGVGLGAGFGVGLFVGLGALGKWLFPKDSPVKDSHVEGEKYDAQL